MKRLLILLIFLFFCTPLCFADDITDAGMSQKDLVKLLDNMKTAIMNCPLADAGVTASTTTTLNIATGTTINYTIDGIFHSLNPSSSISFSTATQNISTYCKYLVSVNTSGNYTITKGSEGSTSTLAILPTLPTSKCPLGYFQVLTGASNQFIGGTTSLSHSGVTTTYVRLRVMDSGNSKVSLLNL